MTACFRTTTGNSTAQFFQLSADHNRIRRIAYSQPKQGTG